VALWLGLNAAIALRCIFAPQPVNIAVTSDRKHLRLVEPMQGASKQESGASVLIQSEPKL
jgi:hypothetical protein